MGIDGVVVFIHPENPVGTEALHGEGSGDAHGFGVFEGFVVEVFELGLGGDGCVDGGLPPDAGLPEAPQGFGGGPGPVGGCFTGDFPFEEFAGADLPAAGHDEGGLGFGVEGDGMSGTAPGGHLVYNGMAGEGAVEIGEGLEYGRLVFVVEYVDFGVVGDRFEGDVGDALVDESVADVAVG